MPSANAVESIAHTAADAASVISTDITNAVDSAKASLYAMRTPSHKPYLYSKPATSTSNVHRLPGVVQDSLSIHVASVQSQSSIIVGQSTPRAAGSVQGIEQSAEEIQSLSSKKKPRYQRQDFWLNAKFWAYAGPTFAAFAFFLPFMVYGLHALSERGKKK